MGDGRGEKRGEDRGGEVGYIQKQWKDYVPQKKQSQTAALKQLSIKHKTKKREKLKGDGIIPTRGGVSALPFARA